MSRKALRRELARLLAEALAGAGKPVQQVLAYRAGDLLGQSPVVVVSSLGSSRPQLSFQGTVPRHRLQVDVFVLYADPASGWGEEQAEDRLDDIEQAVADFIDAHPVWDGFWQGIDRSEWSERVDVEIGGKEYTREVLVLTFE